MERGKQGRRGVGAPSRALQSGVVTLGTLPCPHFPSRSTGVTPACSMRRHQESHESSRDPASITSATPAPPQRHPRATLSPASPGRGTDLERVLPADVVRGLHGGHAEAEQGDAAQDVLLLLVWGRWGWKSWGYTHGGTPGTAPTSAGIPPVGSAPRLLLPPQLCPPHKQPPQLLMPAPGRARELPGRRGKLGINPSARKTPGWSSERAWDFVLVTLGGWPYLCSRRGSDPPARTSACSTASPPSWPAREGQ